MGKRIEAREKVVQRSVGFKERQIRFFDANPSFDKHKYCRIAIDQQIKDSGQKEFLEDD